MWSCRMDECWFRDSSQVMREEEISFCSSLIWSRGLIQWVSPAVRFGVAAVTVSSQTPTMRSLLALLRCWFMGGRIGIEKSQQLGALLSRRNLSVCPLVPLLQHHWRFRTGDQRSRPSIQRTHVLWSRRRPEPRKRHQTGKRREPSSASKKPPSVIQV